MNSLVKGIDTDAYHYDWSRILPAAQSFYKLGRIISDDENLYIIGTKEQSNGDCDALLIKMDQNGTEIWNRTWGNTEENLPINLILDNGTIYIVGACGDGAYPDPLFLLAYSETGEELWNRTWSRPAMETKDWGTGSARVGDAIYISGWSLGFGPDGIEALMVKFNLTDMAFEWSRTWGGAGDQFSDDITYLNNSLYLGVYEASPGGAYLLKYDLGGNLLWNRTWGNDSGIYSVTTDGVDILVAGDTRVGGNLSGCLRVYSETGELLREEVHGQPGFSDSFFEVSVSNGIAYCAGTVRNRSVANSSDAVIIGYDIETGAEVLNFTWDGDDEQICNGITIIGGSDIYFTGGTRSFGSGAWELFILKYTNRSRLEDIPASFEVKYPSGRPFLELSNGTDASGNVSESFILPLEAPEGTYDCSASADLFGAKLVGSTSFTVVWPWSPVMNITSSITPKDYFPGDFIALSAYAGYEYPPAQANKSAPGIYLTEEILAPNGTILLTALNNTNGAGRTDLGFTVPDISAAGTHTVRVSGFEGLIRTVRFNITLHVKQAPMGDKGPVDIPVVPMAGTTTICLLAIGVAIGATETGKFALVVPFVPLYTRIRRDKALSHRVRHQLIGYLTDNPGQHYNAIKKALGLSNSVMVYHLLVLEREGFIRSEHDGTMKRFYPVSVKTPGIRKRTPKELETEMLAAVGERPGITHKEIMERLVVGNEVVKYHMRKLVRAQRILSSKKGNTRIYYPTKK